MSVDIYKLVIHEKCVSLTCTILHNYMCILPATFTTVFHVVCTSYVCSCCKVTVFYAGFSYSGNKLLLMVVHLNCCVE